MRTRFSILFRLAVISLVGVVLWGTALGAFDVVVLDAGHGGEDGGAYRFNVAEKDMTLDLVMRLDTLLKDRGVKTVLTRKDDVFVPLEERANIANRYPNAVFVSIHFNAHADVGTTGLETYYLSPEGARFGNMVQAQLSRRFNTRDRGVKMSNLKVLRETKCPAILIECGFLTNRWENQRCAANWYRQILAEEIAKGILRYR